ncbi:hypothetical protein P170DRAFT_436147 [Aspergillus steynii IBT 23096]|uniref:DUF92 domain protein n=1 Tax=Aspergillus steynii IBT 23096 TaxID=1392250 RepID=A0A2I2GDV6_9EURO|nr:uncharacterized protein P170DRAFT_436147 [Aspergillus steynii IBT 23096]PLB51075.1 hypothetical protein P170DRAFT_436147 [Aspergillus steynii IBT 23096]
MKPFIAIPGIFALLYRAWSRKSLTPLGLVAAGLTASAHALHPWSAPFALLGVFYLSGMRVTKVKHDVKESLTLSASGSHGGEGQRTHIQVLANSIVASVLILFHTRALAVSGLDAGCFSNGGHASDLLMVGIVSNYVAVAADTFSSELGILSKSKPRLITSPTLRVVPPGTNGGVTGTGLLAGALGAVIVAATSAWLIPFCSSGNDTLNLIPRAQWILGFTAWGTLGSLLDSFLGGILQASVVDKRTGKVVEGTGGKKVLITPSGVAGTSTSTAVPASTETQNTRQRKSEAEAAETTDVNDAGSRHESRRVESGWDILDNNAVNVLMTAIMSVGGMGVASWIWGLSIGDITI